MVSHFRRPKAILDIKVSSGPFYVGDTVDLEVSLASQESFHVRKGVVELVCTESYFGSSSGSAGTQYYRESM